MIAYVFLEALRLDAADYFACFENSFCSAQKKPRPNGAAISDLIVKVGIPLLELKACPHAQRVNRRFMRDLEIFANDFNGSLGPACKILCADE